MISKIEVRHRLKPAYVYIRQSTMSQVRFHQESTQRQYALKNKAMELGWSPSMIRVLDGDLGLSGSQMSHRKDFKVLVADVSMGQVGAILSLEASRLARSCLDWQRLIELCALTGTLVVDEDGCYDPGEFNDGLLLGLKGTIAQAELHFIRVRLQGGRRNKAKRGELRFPLPVGFSFDDQGRTVLDPDEEVQGAVRLVFSAFRNTGTAYGVVQEFAGRGIRFPKRVYGGAWNGRLIWGRISHGRVLAILKNPSYAGTYAFGRFRSMKEISPQGEICQRTRTMPKDEWLVNIPEHHEGYITWEEHLENCRILQGNRTNSEGTLLSGPAREGHAILQGLQICAACGHKLVVRYQSKGGIHPFYECTWRKREALPALPDCVNVRSDPLDSAVCRRLMEVVNTSEIKLALESMEELEKREQGLCKQWEMRIQRDQYETDLAERRYMEVDPSNRLVANTLEKRWNEAMIALEVVREQYAQFKQKELHAASPDQKSRLLALAENFPRLWNAPTTKTKDKKRMLRLLIKDITVERSRCSRQAVLHIRWQGGKCEDLPVDLPPKSADKLRYPEEIVEKVRDLARDEFSDKEIAALFNKEGRISSKGRLFTASMIHWIRFKHNIRIDRPMCDDEVSVGQLAERLGVSTNVVYYWIEHGAIEARRRNRGSRQFTITLDSRKEQELIELVKSSSRIQSNKTMASLNPIEGGAL
jgi:DNA invertase Pin-like site-specific DNA recombinase